MCTGLKEDCGASKWIYPEIPLPTVQIFSHPFPSRQRLVQDSTLKLQPECPSHFEILFKYASSQERGSLMLKECICLQHGHWPAFESTHK
jgi:hypothetical protein